MSYSIASADYYQKQPAQSSSTDDSAKRLGIQTKLTRLDDIAYSSVGVILFLLLARLVLGLIGARDNPLAQAVYALTGSLVWVFNNLFVGYQTATDKFEPGTLAAIVFFPLVAWAIRGLLRELHQAAEIARSKTGGTTWSS